MIISLIAAMSENRVIGRDGGLPWHLPADLGWFKATTLGHHMIMGRRTFESNPGVLPGRTSIVVTRNPGYAAPEGVLVAPGLEAALAIARAAGETETFLTGGHAIYRDGLPRADRLYLTTVHAEVEGDTLFPEFDREAWTLVDAVEHAADDRHAYAFTMGTYERAASPPGPRCGTDR